MTAYYLLITKGVRVRKGESTHMDAEQLAARYHIPMSRCLVFNPALHKFTDADIKRLVWLPVRPAGDYNAYLIFATTQWNRMEMRREKEILQSVANAA